MIADAPQNSSLWRAREWLRRPVRFASSAQSAAPVGVPGEFVIPVGRARRVAAVLAIAIPVAMMTIGLALAIVASRAAERSATEGVGSFGVEFGAALWFGGAVTLGARPSPTVRRVVVFAATIVGGVGLIAIALIRAWTGAGLALAMEFGVGMLAIVLIDTLVLSQFQRRLDTFATSEVDSVTFRVGRTEPA